MYLCEGEERTLRSVVYMACNVVHALREILSSHLAVTVAVLIELLGAFLHRMDAYTDSHVQGKGGTVIRDEFNIRQVQHKLLGMLGA